MWQKASTNTIDVLDDSSSSINLDRGRCHHHHQTVGTRQQTDPQWCESNQSYNWTSLLVFVKSVPIFLQSRCLLYLFSTTRLSFFFCLGLKKYFLLILEDWLTLALKSYKGINNKWRIDFGAVKSSVWCDIFKNIRHNSHNLSLTFTPPTSTNTTTLYAWSSVERRHRLIKS